MDHLAEKLCLVNQAYTEQNKNRPKEKRLPFGALLRCGAAKKISFSFEHDKWDLHIGEGILHQLKPLMQSNIYLRSVDLSGLKLSNKCLESLYGIICLTDLNLERCSIADKHLLPLMDNMTCLARLNVASNKITSKGAETLAKHPRLTCIDLRGNRIGNRGARALWNRLHQCYVELDANKIEPALLGRLRNRNEELSSSKEDGEVFGLAIVGGGIRGLMSVDLLATAVEKVAKETGKPFHLAKCMDAMAGTSIGGICVLGLNVPGADGNPRFTPRYLRELLRTQGLYVFPEEHGTGISEPRYKPDHLESLLAQHFGELTLSSCISSNVYIPAVALNSQEVGFFDSHAARDDNNRDYKMKYAGRATSAAPTYFSATQVTSCTGESSPWLVDGGMQDNNPVMMLAEKLREQHPYPEEITIVVIGTGVVKTPEDLSALKNGGILMWVGKITNFLMRTQEQAVDDWVKETNATDSCTKIIFADFYLNPGEDAMDDASPENITRLLSKSKDATNEPEFEKVVEVFKRAALKQQRKEAQAAAANFSSLQ